MIFCQKVPKLNSRPVYCSRLYGTLKNILSLVFLILQQFKFVNWRIGEFVFWCHEQVICLFFFCCTRNSAFPFFQKLINVAYWIIIVFGKFQEINKHSPYNKNMMCILHKFLLKTIEQTYFFSIFFHCFQIAIAILWMIWYVTCQAFVQHICAYIHDISTVHTYLWP